MSDPDAPDYLEAFPELAMSEVARRPRETGFVTWFNQMREEVGSAEVSSSSFRLRLHHHFKTNYGGLPEFRIQDFYTSFAARGLHGYRLTILCRACGTFVSRLFYRAADWFCQSCHCLNYRSTFLTPQQRWQEEYDGIRYFVGSGRPPRMREKDYARQRSRMAELAAKLDGSGRRPSHRFDRLVFAVWSDTDPAA